MTTKNPAKPRGSMSLRGAAVVHVQVRSDEEISLLGSACCVCRGWVGGWVLHRHKPPSLRHPFPIIEVRTRRLTHKGRRRFLFLPDSIPVPSRYHIGHTCGSGGSGGLGGLGGLGCGHDVCVFIEWHEESGRAQARRGGGLPRPQSVHRVRGQRGAEPMGAAHTGDR